ncbi:MAG: pyridoxamine 5'-phosphate oxidase family protein [Phycisphaerae bacterium]
MITSDMRAVIAAQRLCFAATVTPDGRPNLSPKGTIRVWDDEHLFFCDIASPATRANLAGNPWMELNVVDPISRRGYRFFGRATIHIGDEVHRAASSRIAEEEGAAYPVVAVVLLHVESAASLVSPGYAHVPDEWTMREAWKRKRQTLDPEFEAHVRRVGALHFPPRPDTPARRRPAP